MDCTVKTVPLQGGGKLVKKEISGVNINFLHAPNKKKGGMHDEKVTVISDEAYKKIKREKGMGPVRTDAERETLISQHKPSSAAPSVTGAIKRIANDPLRTRAIEREKASRGLVGLVEPQTYRPEHRKLLEYLLGTKNEKELEELNSKIRYGVINNTCPPFGVPELTEEYIDPVTGVRQCREPSVPHIIKNDKNCPDPSGDPYAIEKYIDSEGNVQCRRPVIRGYFQCPPNNAAEKDKKYHKTLGDGTGVCLDSDPNITRMSELSISPNITSLLERYPDDVRGFYTEIIQLYSAYNLDGDAIDRLNTIFVNTAGYKDFVRQVRDDPFAKNHEDIIRIITSDDHIKIANFALFEYRKALFGEPTYEDKIRFFGINLNAMKGGKKKKSKPKATKKKSSKPKAKASKKKAQ